MANGLDSQVAFFLGLCDRHRREPLSYVVVRKQSKRFERALHDGWAAERSAYPPGTVHLASYANWLPPVSLIPLLEDHCREWLQRKKRRLDMSDFQQLRFFKTDLTIDDFCLESLEGPVHGREAPDQTLLVLVLQGQNRNGSF